MDQIDSLCYNSYQIDNLCYNVYQRKFVYIYEAHYWDFKNDIAVSCVLYPVSHNIH